ncbi:MAG: glycosyltransferase [Prevotella sp.]|nr:glycosyltransferase [Prevotella sp.]
MSKIILSFATLAQGGAARVCANLSTPLCDNYDEVILVTWADKPQFYEYDHRARWYCVEKEVGGKNDLRRMRWFRSLVKREKPDLILSFLEPFNIRVLLCTMGLGVKTIVAERNDPMSVNKYWIMNQFEKFVYRRADKILVQTETVKKFFDGKLSGRTHIIYNPVNLSEEMVGKALLTEKKKRIVSMARLMPQKNHDVLIKAFAKFCKLYPDYTLTIYGEGPLQDSLEQLAKSLGVGDKVSLPGPSKTIHQDILDAEMMCLVSQREGMSNAMIEAMCLGLPCICTKVSGAIDLIEDGKNGLLVDIGNEEQLAEKMTLLANQPSAAKGIGENASKLYERLNKDKIYEEWMTFLKENK